MKNKNVKKPYLLFPSNASTDVTGSAHLLRFKEYTMLLDCGWIQGSDILTDYKANRDQVLKLKPRTITYVAISHLNIDHHGLLPAMVSKGMSAHIYVPSGSIPFLKIMWEDTFKIMQSDCEKIQKKHGIRAPLLFEENDIEKALNRCVEVEPLSKYQINEYMTLTYYPAGHIHGSCQMFIELKDGNIIKRVGYTGDIGGNSIRPFVAPRQTLPFADCIIGECTYSAKGRINSIKDRDKDIEKIKTIVRDYNKILMATFSLDRCQTLLSLLYDNGIMDEIQVYLDSPLAQKFCEIWPDEYNWPRPLNKVKFIKDTQESKALQLSNEHCLILAGSGTLTGGRAVSHLKTLLPNPKNHLIFTGYTQENSVASLIKSNQKTIVIDGVEVENNSNYTALVSMSSHANHDELLEYYGVMCRFNKIVLVHSNQNTKIEFSNELQDYLHSQGKSARAIASNEDCRIYL